MGHKLQPQNHMTQVIGYKSKKITYKSIPLLANIPWVANSGSVIHPQIRNAFCPAFSFQPGRGEGATFFGHPKHGFVPHQPPPATPPKFDPNEIKVIHLRCTSRGDDATSALVSLSSKEVGDEITKATSDCKGLRTTVKLTIQERQAQTEVAPSASALVVKALKEPP